MTRHRELVTLRRAQAKTIRDLVEEADDDDEKAAIPPDATCVKPHRSRVSTSENRPLLDCGNANWSFTVSHEPSSGVEASVPHSRGPEHLGGVVEPDLAGGAYDHFVDVEFAYNGQ
jgi:hypothetical protein